MADAHKIPDEAGSPDADQPAEEEEPVAFSDRIIAFLILILPFS